MKSISKQEIIKEIEKQRRKEYNIYQLKINDLTEIIYKYKNKIADKQLEIIKLEKKLNSVK